ncbi:MAG TPA: hypothetical protein VJL81_07905 [Solirubrobacterales bacterium]|nr:hypothetical protein [Solirubrobacterales bacterium]
MKRFRPRLTYANVIASLALFVALGGSAVAAGLAKNSVGPNQLKKGAVSAPKLAKQAVTSGKIAPKAVVAGKLGPNAVLPGNLGAGIIDSSKISAGAVTAEKIKNNVVTGNKITNGAVTSQKLAAAGVATSNLAEKAVTTAKLNDGAVTAAKLAPEVLNNVNPLKTGQTLRGVFNIGGTNTTEESVVERGSITFQQPLLATPTLEIVASGKTTANCKGLGGGGTTPEAAAGVLCLYLSTETNLETVAGLTVEGTNRLGTGLIVKAKKGVTKPSEFAAAGVWAVTAP